MTLNPLMSQIIQIALQEDLGQGDLTTNLVVPHNLTARAKVLARKPLVLSGTLVFETVMRQVDPQIECRILFPDGSKLARGDMAIILEGPARSILAGERVALNFLMCLSGVATLTSAYVEAIGPDGPQLLDTRKTSPGLRGLVKTAVRHGGGKNHRSGLFDGILIKDNHVLAAGGVAQALALAKAKAPVGQKIEIEVETLAETLEALRGGADIILLDNMSPTELKKAVALAEEFFAPNPRAVILEASGGIDFESLSTYRDTGVDYISLGAITHSAPAADLALDFEPNAFGTDRSR
ncbi:MAG: carboxylating nicotinate-nucleotide diphosphorylase [Deltaproteobacteria bacterium]|jgi:nicotinate-nucleotide pyrophosphorylase (carboxylating)|nr:carboxylating nicotinate-nucleotide diphosphorylase [Deltaproteobacteria bacterium]